MNTIIEKLKTFGHIAIGIDQIQTYDYPVMEPSKNRGIYIRPVCVVATANDNDYFIIELAKSADGKFHVGYDYKLQFSGGSSAPKKEPSYDSPFEAAFHILNLFYHNGGKNTSALAKEGLNNLQATNQLEIPFKQ